MVTLNVISAAKRTVVGSFLGVAVSARAEPPGRHQDGCVSLVDTMMHDGLTDVFNGYPMRIIAEDLAGQHQVRRLAQDQDAVASQGKAAAARGDGRFKDEIAPVTIKRRTRSVPAAHAC